jgi:hypothetical protein
MDRVRYKAPRGNGPPTPVFELGGEAGGKRRFGKARYMWWWFGGGAREDAATQACKPEEAIQSFTLLNNPPVSTPARRKRAPSIRPVLREPPVESQQ